MTQGILLSSDVTESFMIHGIFKYTLFGQELWITTTHVCLLIVMLILIIFSICAGRAMKKAKEIPTGFQNVVELIVEKLDGMVSSTMGEHAVGWRNYIGTIFIFILISNFSGLIGLRPPTADYGVTLPLGVLTFTLIHLTQFRTTKLKTIWTDLCSPLPPWCPLWMVINLIGDFAVPISLSLRLFANILSGTIMMALIYGLLNWIALFWPAALHVYFDLFSGAIQTYVFCMLTMTYITNAYGDRPQRKKKSLEAK